VATAPISGQCDAAFNAVGDAFAGNFVERGEVGAAVAVIVNGRTVVDLVGAERYDMPCVTGPGYRRFASD
jgi:CubicO group peptidase (beta-lactamase class C family)